MLWRACERFAILPPAVEKEWESNGAWTKAMLMAYSQIRSIEEDSKMYEFLSNLFKASRGI